MEGCSEGGKRKGRRKGRKEGNGGVYYIYTVYMFCTGEKGRRVVNPFFVKEKSGKGFWLCAEKEEKGGEGGEKEEKGVYSIHCIL